MPFYPTLPCAPQQSRTVDAFTGYNHNLIILPEQFYDMKNLSGEFYPLLSTRRKRAAVSQLTAPAGLLAKAKLCCVDGTKLIYGGEELTAYLTAKGLSISANEDMLPKKLVSMGAYICIFPDKLYINTENYTDCGSMEAEYIQGENSLTLTLCRADGSDYPSPTLADAEPQAPENGALWLDSSDAFHTLRQYSAASAAWEKLSGVYVKMSCTGIGAAFQDFDGVSISGCAASDEASESLKAQTDALNGSKIIYAKGDDYIVVTGILDQSVTIGSGVSVRRSVPTLDYVTEAENRLWGCRYGVENGESVNAIYACALGDFKNWNQFMGLSTDSYAASVGTDGAFTGAVTHLGYPVFFKENCLHKVFISSIGAHRIADSACRGVQSGSHNSLCVVNERLYYKSPDGVCAYDGSLPVSVSQALGTERYTEAAAGAAGERYYISMKDAAGNWQLFVLDTARWLWYREDEVHALCFAAVNGRLYYIDAASKTLMAPLGGEGTEEDKLEWEAETGLFGLDSAARKYVSRINLRMKLPEGSAADLYIQYDSEESWQFTGHMEGIGTGSFLLPVRPRRCDHFRFKLCGSGEMKLYSMNIIFERGRGK